MVDDSQYSWMVERERSIYEELSKRVLQEHTLLSNRMAWLVSANAFLFTPVAILVSNQGSMDDQKVLLSSICVLGILMALVLGIPMVLAVHTMQVLRKRYAIFLRAVEDDKEFHFVDPEQNLAPYDWPRRMSRSHEIGMALQLLVPLILLCTWIWLFIKIHL